MNIDYHQYQEQLKLISGYLETVGTNDEAHFVEYMHRSRILLQLMRYHGVCPVPDRSLKQRSFSESTNPLPDLPDPQDSCWVDDSAEQ